MARSYPCDFCGGVPALLNVSNLATGQQTTVDLGCIPALCEGLLQLVNIVMLPEGGDAGAGAETTTDGEGAASAAPRPRRRRGVAVDGEARGPELAPEAGDRGAESGA